MQLANCNLNPSKYIGNEKKTYFYLQNLNHPKIKKNCWTVLFFTSIFAFDCAILKDKNIIYKK
jgi:hypothetical protein